MGFIYHKQTRLNQTFNIVMDKIKRQMKEVDRGFEMGQKLGNNVLCGPNAVLMAQNEDEQLRLSIV